MRVGSVWDVVLCAASAVTPSTVGARSFLSACHRWPFSPCPGGDRCVAGSDGGRRRSCQQRGVL